MHFIVLFYPPTAHSDERIQFSFHVSIHVTTALNCIFNVLLQAKQSSALASKTDLEYQKMKRVSETRFVLQKFLSTSFYTFSANVCKLQL